MDNVIKSFEEYVYDCIGVSVSRCERLEPTALPFFLLDAYDFYRTKILHRPCVLLVPRSDNDISPATVRKHVDRVSDTLHETAVFVCPSVSSYNRKRLIDYKVPFVVPGNQMYLPELMIDLREYFIAARTGKAAFSPSTQAVVLYVLYHYPEQPFIPSELAKPLGYSGMAMTRAFDNIEAAHLGRIEEQGRQRRLWISEQRRAFWQKTLPYLKTPVRRNIWLGTVPEELRHYAAGQTALSRYSMLAPPAYTTYAATKNDWDYYKRHYEIEELKCKDEAKYKLQIWSYAPALFAEGDSVDKLSLYLSLKDNTNERIEAAIEAMMGTVGW